MTENEFSKVVVEAAIEVHRTLGGPGLLESVYEEALASELELRGLTVERQMVVPVFSKGKRLATRLRVDLIVAGRVVVECKAVSTYNSGGREEKGREGKRRGHCSGKAAIP